MPPKKIVLKDAYKGFTLDQDKIISPKETINRFKEKAQQVNLDILSYTQRIDNGRLDIPVYFSVCGKDAAALTHTKKQMGKGATPEQAEASATIELAERFSFFAFKNEAKNFINATYPEVQKDAIPYEMIVKSVHDTSDDLDKSRALFEKLNLNWTWGYDLTTDKSMLVPFDWFYTINEFNGTSAGNGVEEALCQGICEIVERHVSSLVSKNHMIRPLIDPASATDPMVKEMLAKYENAGIKLYISDFTLDMGIPTIAVLAYDPATFPDKSEIVWTAGTTPDPEKALSRALTEVAQLAGDFNSGSNYVASGLPKFNSLKEADYVMNARQTISLRQLPDISNDNIKIEVQNCLTHLKRQDMNVLVVDTTHPRLSIPAFYTIVPGAHFRERSMGTSVGMFTAKLITEKLPPQLAIQQLTEFDDLLPGKYYIKFYLGQCYQVMGNFKKAINSFSRALDLEPTSEDIPSIYSFLGECYKDMEDYDMALEALTKGNEYDDERPEIYNLMGFCHFKLKEHPEAIACFEKVIKLNPASAIDYANIASNYRDLNNKEKAIEYYEKALAIDPAIGFARENLLKLLKDQ